MVRTSYNPFILENEDFKLSIQPGEYKKGDQEWQSDVAFSVKDKNGVYIKLTDSQIQTVGELMDMFGFKVDKIERLLDSEFTKILLKPEDQIKILNDPNYQPPKRESRVDVIQKKIDSSNFKDVIQDTMNDIFADIKSGKITGTPITDVVYNGDPERYSQFRAGLAASVKHVLKTDASDNE